MSKILQSNNDSITLEMSMKEYKSYFLKKIEKENDPIYYNTKKQEWIFFSKPISSNQFLMLLDLIDERMD